MKVMYIAAHGGFAGQQAALGGGATIYNWLTAEWARTQPFSLEGVTPALLGAAAPSARDLIRYSERQYAAFCRAFQQAATTRVLQEDPRHTVVLCNDIAEGPDFRRLHAAGFPIATIFHVDVVHYVAAIYLRGWASPQRLVQWHRWWEQTPLAGATPLIVRLIFAQQRAAMECSRLILVPSAAMRDILLACYPHTPPERVRVLPWGIPASSPSPPAVLEPCMAALRRKHHIPSDARILLTLSRLSPEKGTDLFLDALACWERQAWFPSQFPVTVVLCGEAAYMQGERFAARLRRQARRLRRVQTIFAGYVSGLEKEAFLRMAHLYVFPSRHESYGLTLLEAFAAGLPVVCLDHSGARTLMRDDFGLMLERDAPRPLAERFARALTQLLADDVLRRRMGEAARAFAATQRFSDTAATMAMWLHQSAQERAANSRIT